MAKSHLFVARTPFSLRLPIGLLLGSLLVGGCVSVESGPLPDPLPETLDWARAEGGLRTAFLGLEGRENDSGSLDALTFAPGMRITEVVDGSPAKEAGFQTGDVLLRWDDVAIDGPETMTALLDRAEGDAQVILGVQRGDSAFDLTVSLRRSAEGVATQVELTWRSDPARSRANWLTGRGGVVLVASAEGGPFPIAGIKVGSVVLSLEGEPMRSARGLVRALQATDPGERVKVEFLAPGSDEPKRASVDLFAPSRRITEASLPILAGYHSTVDGESKGFYLLDLYVISLLRYRRDGAERELRILRFISFSSEAGELMEVSR